ncbi:ATP synthase F0 subunit B [Streptomyces sp. NPDC001744]|uniref:ATP synthase F0 subunit B n=1 Tax=Streptomyces sp. NPDC001744 TaxID=3364606 RepID=UPI0036A2CA9F
MDVQKKLDEIVATVRSARSMPMSASCVVNRAELLALLEEVREALPGSLAQARELIGDREQMVEQARREAERIIEAAHAERGSIVSDTQVARESQEEADRILSEARREAEEIRAEADDYVDSKLANFEVVLNKTIGSVERGREKLLGCGPGAGPDGYADQDAPEYGADPRTPDRRTAEADEFITAKLGAFEAVLGKTLEAVGRGRQKLHGRIATDDLGEHMAAQDGLSGAVHTSDADYLAGLAELSDPVPAQPPAQQQPQPDPYGYPQQPQHQPDAYAAYQQPQQPPQPDPYAYQQPQQADPYGYQQQDPYAYQQPAPPAHDPQRDASLEETSFFDTSMIDLEQLRRYEQQYEQGR